MRRYLPPTDGRPASAAVARVEGARPPADGRSAPEPGPGAPAPRRRVRVRAIERGRELAHLRRWCAGGARDLPAPPGVAARERSGDGRRRRLAVAPGRAAHWSAPEPPTAADERAWRGLLDRLAARAGGRTA